MYKIKRKLRNNLAGILVFGGMSMFSLSIPSSAYLHHIQPEEPKIVSEYDSLNQELHYLRLIKQFNLEEALNSKHMEQYVQKADSLSARIKDIESSNKFEKIFQYKQEKKKHNKYWVYPILSVILGTVSMLYGIHGIKINSHTSKK